MKKIFVIALMGISFLSAKAQFVEGRHFQQVSGVGTDEPSVTEFFSLFCGHCYQFESMLDDYKKGLKSGTKFQKSHVDYIPRDNEAVSFGMVKAFLTIKALKQDKKLISAFFDHIHAQLKPIEKEADIKAIFLENGVSESDFDKHYNDDNLTRDAKRMIGLWKERKITTVPTMVVNGKYKIVMSSVSSLEDLIKLTNFLLEKK